MTSESGTLEALAVAEKRRRVLAMLRERKRQASTQPLSFAQQRLWFLDQLEPGSAAYNVPAALRLRGSLDAGALRGSLRELARRHEALRTRFPAEDGRPAQVVEEPSAVPLPVVDLAGLPAGGRDAEVDRLARAEARRPFDLARGPLLRSTLLRTGEAEHVALFTLHHIVSDGWSTGVMVREIGALYEALSRGEPSPLPELPLQYADFAAWQRGWLRGEVLERQLGYWREALRGAPPLLELPVDRPRAAAAGSRAGSVALGVPADTVGALRALAHRRGGTLFMALLAGFQALLARYAGQDDVVVGTPVAGRGRVELEGLIGLFVNTLVLRGDLSGDPTFTGLLERVREATLGAFAHGELPFDRLIDELGVERSPTHTPLFQVLFALQNNERGTLRLGGVELETLGTSAEAAKFELSLSLAEVEGRLEGWLAYRADLFRAETVERMAAHLRTLLAAVAAEPERRLSEVELLGEAERARVLGEWNATARDLPRLLVHEQFAAQAARTPAAPAVMCGGDVLTYAELERRSSQLARALLARGVGAEARVGICLERSAEMVVAVLGVLAAGGAYVPLDPAHPPERLAFLLEDAAVGVLLTRESLLARLPAAGLEIVCLDAEHDRPAGGRETAPAVEVSPGQLAYVVYTSGSTGRPKGVRVSHAALRNTLQGAREAFGFGAADVMPNVSSFAFDIWAFEALLPLLGGGAVRLVPAEGVLAVDALVEVVAGASALHAVPALMRQVVAAVAAGRGTLPGLGKVFVGGDAVPPELLAEMRAVFPAAEVHVLYGPTEGTIICAAHRVEGETAGHAVGRPLPNARLYVCDAHGSPVPVGVAGELWIGGAGVARDYLGRPGLTAEKFVPDPFGGEAGARVYRTGDRVRWRAGGELEFLGRIDTQVKVRGFRIEPGEVEAALERLAGVREAVVVVREDASGERRLVGYVVADGEAPTGAALREQLRASLPEYMVPAAFVVLEALPLTPNGKIDRRALPAPEAGAPGGERVGPRTEAERVLAGIWAELLRRDEVGVHDNFFELGGDSILSIQAVSRARRAGLHLTPRQLFEHPTIAGLARLGATGVAGTAEQGAVSGPVELTPIQAWHLARELSGRERFNLSQLFAPRAPLAGAALERALAHLRSHHDALRLRFRREGAEWRQENAASEAASPLVRIDLAALDGEAKGRALERAADQVQGSLSPERGPLFRAAHFVGGADGAERLLVGVHHLAVDGVSWRVLLEDLESAYAQASRGDILALPPKTTSFQRWAERLAGHARAGGFDAELPFWTDEARARAAPLPVDSPSGPAEDTEGSTRVVALSLEAAETTALLQEAPAAYRTQINDLLLTALARTVAAWTGGSGVLVDLEGHGREELFADVDLSRTVGWFTTVHPVLLEPGPDPSPGAALKAVKEQLRRVPNRGIGYGALRWLSPDPAVREALAALPGAGLRFEYLGQFDQALTGAGLLALAREPMGRGQDPRAPRTHRLALSGAVLEGRLHLRWSYGGTLYRAGTVEALAPRYADELRGLIAHCTSARAGGATPSDFPLAGVGQAALDGLVGAGRAALDVEDVFPLSPMQEGLLFHALYAPEAGEYVGQFGFDLLGELDEAAFRRAWQSVVERHGALRSGFVWDGLDRPLQLVRRRAELDVVREDWRALSAAEQGEAMERYLAGDRARGFELGRAPLMRLALFRTGEAEWRAVWTHHHLAMDGWSLPLVYRDVVALYDAFRQGRAAPAARGGSYRDYVAYLRGRDLGAAERFWRSALAGFAAPTPLGLPPGGAGAGAQVRQLRLGEADTAALLAFARARQLTPNTLVQGAWALLLSRLSGEADVVFGAVGSGRPAELAGVEETVGLFINTLPVRVVADPGARVGAWLAALQEEQAAAREFAYAPLAQVQGWSEVGAGEGLFESILAYQNYPMEAALAEGRRGFTVRPWAGAAEQTNYALTLSAAQGRELVVRAVYRAERLDGPGVEGALARLGLLLRELACDAGRELGALAWMTEAERARVLEEWNATARDLPRLPVHEQFAAQAARTPAAPAVACGGDVLTYAQLEHRSNQLARALRRRGVGPDVPVALCLERSAETVVAVLATLKAGGAYLALDPSYPPERLALLLADAGAPVLLTREYLLARLPEHGAEVVCLDRDAAALAGESGQPLDSGVSPENLAYLIYTSGSTGTPKGVLVEHRGLANYLAWFDAAVLGPEGFALPLVSRLSFDAHVRQLFPPLLRGEPVWVLAEETLADGRALLEALAAHPGRVSFGGVPSLWGALLELLRRGEAPVPAGLAAVLLGGEALGAELLERTHALFPEAVVWNHYGPTEATVNTTVARLDRGAEVTLGRPVGNVRVYVLDGAGQPVPVGVAGELYVGGAGVTRGYLGRPELTAERYVPDAYSGEAGSRLYRSGDRVRWRGDGRLEYVGRLDAQVKVRGFRIEPGEIEAVLAGHAGVREAVVVVREDAPGERRLVGYVAGEGVTEGELRAWAGGRLPEYMVPGAIVVLETLPLTPNGKVDRRALPAPERRGEGERGYVAPRSKTERVLAGVWAEVLGVERVGVEENFFELGGDSILSIQVVSRARRAGVRITPRQLFENPTVAALARLAGTAAAPAVEDGTVTGEVVPTPIQHRFFERELPEPHHFNMSLLLAPAEALDPAALERAVARLVEHHDALRMRARRTASGWRQEIVGPTAPPFTVVDLAGLPDAARPAALDRAVAAAQRSLDLARGPLARFVLLRTGGERPQRLLAAVHHLVVDGVSWRILLEDLRSAYEQALGGGPVSLPPRTTSFPAWAERLAAYAASPAAAAEAGYWLAAIPGDLPALPADPADGAGPGAAAGSVHAVLPAAETRALLQDVPAAYRTQVNDALLAALARAFAGGLGDGRLLVDLEGHGREDLFADVDLSRTVGWFTSIYPVLLDVRGAADPGAALKAVKEQLRRVPNRGIGYGVLRWLSPDPAVREALAALPRARVSFNYLGQVDGSVSGGAFFTLAPESPGRQVSPRAGRTHLLEVVGAVEGGELRLRFTYGGEFHRRATIEALAGRFIAELRALVDHCRAPGAGGCTPSDFPLAGLDQAALDRLLGDARDVEDVYPLSPMQEGMLFHTLYAPGMGEYVGQFGFVLRGRLDVEAFRRAWQGVVERHDALRSGFVWEELDRPLQVVRRRAPLEFRLDDWRRLAAGAQLGAMERHLAEDRARGFELPRAPLMRLALFRTGDAEHRLVWTYHHAVLDGWSLSLVFRDVVALYDAHAQGRAAPPAGGRSYRDYVAWLQEQDLARAERFWRETLAGFSAPTPLGIERSPGQRSGYATERARVPEAVTARLQALARRESLTLGTVVQGAWALLLSRYGGEDDVAFGTVVSGRPAELEGVEDTVGLFINTLPVRVRTRPEERVLPWLRGLQALNVAMREHEYAPLGQVQRWSDVPAGEPLFRSIFVFENYPVEDVMAGAQRELTVQRTMALDHTGYPLTVGAAPGRELAVYVEYERARFEGAAVGRMLEHVGVLLEGMASGPERALSTLGLLTTAERARVVEVWNDTARPFPRGRCIHDLVAEQAARTPHAPAVLSADGVLTYAGLHASAGRLASRLRARGVGPEARVAVCTGRSPEMAVAILGTLRAGAAYVPLDPAYPPERLAYLLRDSGARVLLAQRSLAGRLPATDAEVVFLDAAGADAPEPAGADAEPGNAAYVIYTSGSTGLPKGVVVEHRSVVAYATDMAARLGLGADDRILQFASPGFDVVVEELFPAWVAGAAVVFSGADLFSPDELLRVIAAEGVTGLELPTAYWHEWVRELAEAGRRLPECVRFVIVGGERVSPERLEQWARLETPLVHVFGLTETAVTSTTLRLEAGEDGSGWENLPVGFPTANTRLYVLDPAGEPVPAGVPGELFIGGPGVARGYHGRPELTAGKFVPDPFGTEPGDRLYRTGDRVRWLEGGALEFLGRIDHQVKVRGYRIEPGEVEAALRTHPGVRDAAVLAREDAPGDRRLVGYVVAGGEPPSAGELREWLKARLPEYMVPGAYVVLDALPLTPNGKVDRRALPAPDGPSGPDRAYAAPRTPAERVLAGVWAELLRVERVGVEDDFFELGGDSILSIQVVSRARRAGVFVTPRQVFEHPTVAALARVAGTEPARVAEQGAVAGPVELTPVQAWFFAQEVPARHRWNMSRLFEVRRPLDPGVLERAAARLLEHHDALRLRFRPDGGAWRQENAAPGGAPCVARIDLSALDEEEAGRALERAADALQGSLRLDRGPLLRMGCFARGRGRTDRLLVAVHHLVVDGVSWRVLLEDLQAACEQAARGEPVALPPKSTSFRAWAARLAEHARSGGFDAELPFWTDDARRGVPALPVDHPGGRAANTVGSARAVPVSLGEDETAALLQEAPRAYRTQVNDLLLAALARALSAWTGDGRLLVQVEGHGREELFADVDLSRTVGWFTTTYPVLLDLRGADGEGAALMRVKEQLRGVPGRGIGYGALRWLGSDAARAALGEIPDPEVHFEYLGQFDQTLAGDALFAVAGEPAGRAADPRGARPYLLGVSGGVLGGRLRMALAYSEAVHRRETVERLAERFAAELRALVAHCTSPGAGGCTPSDFPLAGLDQARLQALVGAGRDVDDVYPLTPMQQGMLFHTLLAPGGGAYVAQFGFRLLGRLDAAAFEGAWRETVRRHAALRTGIVWEGADEPMQVVRRRVDLDVAREDWRDAGAAEQEARREAYLRDDRARGFDTASPPLMRVALFRTGDEEHELVWTHHQMAFDGWSLPLVFRDVAALYGALSEGRAAEPARPRPYRDYVAWLVRRDLAGAEAFWREALRGVEAATPFGVDRALAALPPGEERYGEARHGLGEDATASLLALARREGVTPNTLVQGAWALLLSRYSGEEDVVFGTTVSGRPGEVEGVEEMVGLFINTLPVRVRAAPGAPVAPWLRGVQEWNAALREHEHSPLVQVQRWSGVPAGEPMFESILVFQNYPLGEALGSGERLLRVVRRDNREQADYPVTLNAKVGGELTVRAEYDRRRFEPGTVERMLEHLGTLLAGMAAGPERPLASLSLLTDGERRRVLEDSSGPAAEVPAGCIHELVSAQAARTPHAPAVVSGGAALTYADLDARSTRLARLLRERGVGPGAVVGVCVERSPAMAVGTLGILKAGGAYLPLDPAYPADRLAYLLADAGASLLLTQSALRGAVPGFERALLLDALDLQGAGSDPGPVPDGAGPGDLAYVIYTSGSTGAPKGVMVEHGSLAGYAVEMAARLGLGPGDRFLQFASPGFDVVVEELFPAWVSGAAVVFSRDDLFAPDELMRVVADEGVTCFELPTAYWHEWVRELAAAGGRLPASARFVIVGGERVSPERLEQWARLDTPLVHVFGLTETTVTSTLLRLEAGEDGGAWPNLPVGRPLANAAVYVLDRAGEPVPPGVPGELFVGGPGVARGYLGRPELTAARFVPDPFAGGARGGARLYRTGDRVRRLPDGNLEFLGRTDAQIKVRGFRIEPGEVEAALRAHPGVREAVVVVREDVPGDRRLVGYVVPETEVPATAELRAHLKARLPEHMVPNVFVALDAVPLTPNGKTDRRALPAPEGRPDSADGYAAPESAVERVLAEVWREVLRVERVGVDDDFFELGGDSILSIQVVSRARRAGVFVTPRQLFESPTVAGLARVAAGALSARAEQGPVTGPVELTPAQAWFFEREVPARHHWNMSQMFEAPGALDPAALERAVSHLAAHHDALRLRFREEDGAWRQENAAPDGRRHLLVVDLAAVPEERQRQALGRAAGQMQAGLELERGPLLRAALFRRGKGRSARAMVAVHHLVMDGVSWRILLEDLQTAYGQASRGEPPALPEKTTSFRRWAARLAEHARAGGFDAELPYWTDPARRGLAPLPVDFPGGREANTAGSTRTVSVALEAGETTALLQDVPKAYRTQVVDVLLGALARAAAGWTGDGRLLVNLEGHGREEIFEDVDLTRTVGWFTTMYPVLLDLRGVHGEAETLVAVKEQLRSVPGKGLGYGALRWLGPEAAREALRGFPEPEVHFEYLGQFDQALSGDSLLRMAPESAGPDVDPRGRRQQLLVVSGGVLDGRLRMAFGYGEGVHRRETVEALAGRFLDELRKLVAHGASAEAGGYTPSDFPLADLDAETLRLLEEQLEWDE